MRLRATRLISTGRGRPTWTPAQITTALWLDAADANTITLNGSTVSQWNDLSGNGRHATQAAGANQPTYSATGLLGKPAAVFDGVSDRMSTGTLNVAMSGDYTLLTVLSTTNASTSPSWYACPGFLGGEVPNTVADHGLGFNGLYQITGIGNPDTSYTATNPVTSGAGTMLSWSRVSASGVLSWYQNGQENGQTTGLTGNRTATSSMSLGAMEQDGSGGWLSFTLGEVIVISSSIDTNTRQKLEGYLAWKWGLQASLPVDHPYYSAPPLV